MTSTQRRALYTTTRPSIIVALAACLLGCLFLLPVEQPFWEPLWHLSFLIYVPWPLRILMAVVVIAVALPPLQSRLLAVLHSMPRTWMVLTIGGVLFFLLRERTLYGDGLRKLGLLSVEALSTDMYVWKEPLDSLLVSLTTEGFTRIGLGAEQAIALLSILAGVVYLGTVLSLAQFLFQSPTHRIFLTAGMLALGSSQLWFGHIENYSLVTSATYLTHLLALRYRQGKAPLWAVGLAAGSAVSFHPQALFAMFPLMLLLRGNRWPVQLTMLILSGLILPILTSVTLLARGTSLPLVGNGFAGDPQLFWRLDQALHPAQWIDALLNLWLLAPALPILLAAALWMGQWQITWHLRYLALLAGGLLIYHFSFQNDLPRPQDWNLYAIVGPGVMLFLLYLLLREDGTSPTRPLQTEVVPLLLPVLLFSLLFTSAWVGVNHHYRLLYPDPDLRPFYQRDLRLDLLSALPTAQISPDAPICADPSSDPTSCQRVAPVIFTMPQDGDQRLTLFAHAPARIAFPLQLPQEPAFLWTSIALDPLAWNWGGDGVTFQVWIKQDTELLLWDRHLSPQQPADLDWQEVMVSLDAYRGKSVIIELVTTPGPAGDNAADRAGWGFPWIMRGTVDRRLMSSW